MKAVEKVGLPRWLGGKESTYQCSRHRRRGFNPWVEKIPWRRKRLCIPIFLPRESHGQRSLTGPSPQGCKESDRTEHHAPVEQCQATSSESHLHLLPALGLRQATGILSSVTCKVGFNPRRSSANWLSLPAP